MSSHKFSLIQAIKSGVTLFFRHVLLFVLVGVLFFAARSLLMLALSAGYMWLVQWLNLSAENVGAVLALHFALTVILATISVWLILGNVKIALNVVDSGRASVFHLFKHFSFGLVILQIVLQIIATLIFYFLGTLGFAYGQIVLLVLFLLALTFFGFVFHFVADKNMNVIQALRHSFSVSKRAILPLLILWALFLVLSNVITFLPARWWTGLIIYPLMQPLVLILTEGYRRLVSHS